MSSQLEYHSSVRSLKSASSAGLAVVLTLMTIMAFPAHAQIHGVPASVTSIGFGGRFDMAPGVPASVTSLGPNGLQPRNPFFNEPQCCINPLFPINPNPTFGQRHHHHNRRAFFGGITPFAVPYTPVIMVPSGTEEPAEADQDEDLGGPTIFDRRGRGNYSSHRDPYVERTQDSQPSAAPFATPAEQLPPSDQPQTILIFRDGHQTEVQNYAVVGSTLYDLTPGRYRKIALADLDLSATTKQNDDRGIDFKVPGTETD
jgi:hypothetical protein